MGPKCCEWSLALVTCAIVAVPALFSVAPSGLQVSEVGEAEATTFLMSRNVQLVEVPARPFRWSPCHWLWNVSNRSCCPPGDAVLESVPLMRAE